MLSPRVGSNVVPRHNRLREGGTAIERHFARAAWDAVKSQDSGMVHYGEGTFDSWVSVHAETFPPEVFMAADEYGLDYSQTVDLSGSRAAITFRL